MRVADSLHADWYGIVFAFANRYGKADALFENDANRADFGGFVGCGKVGVAQPAGFAIDDQMFGDATPGKGEDTLVIDLTAGAHAQFAQNAAVEVEQGIGCDASTGRVGKICGKCGDMTPRS